MTNNLMEKIVSLCKRRGFVFPGSEIYGGLAGTYDYGHLGSLLKSNIQNLWWEQFVDSRDNMYRVDAAILMNSKVWEASGHVSGFNDPMVECSNCKGRFRSDYLDDPNTCPSCGKTGTFGEARQFNMMFKTQAGATDDDSATIYLRPETAAGMFVNFKNTVDAYHPKLPFGLAQIGKAFRNEIAPRDFIFRLRELDQMEVEYFVRPEEWETAFEEWRKTMHEYAKEIGLSGVHELEVADEDRAHYSKRTIDFEFDYPFGRKELWGLAYRTDFDLKAHDLEYLDEETKSKMVPHVVEPSLGVDRTFLAVLLSAYREDELGGETRTYLALAPKVAPVKAMVSPLLKNKPALVEKAREVRNELRKVHPAIAWDDNGNIGKRYRRQDEIGTPFCITIDFDTLEDGTVTLRHRDSGEQERLSVEGVAKRLSEALA
ncbi:MAG TPA: glycine--tRNA ligase [Candidatus Paceibacterota bacterium]